MVLLVSFRFSFDKFQHSRCGHLGWLKCTFLLDIPFGHVFEQMLIVWVVGFWATREQGPRRDWRGPGNCGSFPSGLLRRSAAGFKSSGAR